SLIIARYTPSDPFDVLEELDIRALGLSVAGRISAREDVSVLGDAVGYRFRVPGRVNSSRIYWNATSLNDFGLYYNVDGNYVGRMISNGNWETQGNLSVGGEHINVNKVRFAQRSIGSAQIGDLWFGNAFAGLGWYGRTEAGWVKI